MNADSACLLIGSLALALATPVRAQRQTAEARPIGTVAHVWKPVRNGGTEVVAIQVRTELKDFPASAGQSFSIGAPITYAGVRGIADRVEGLEVRDASGLVAFRVEEDPPHPGGFPYYRHWRAERPVTFPLAITYRSVAPNRPPRGPPFGLFAVHGGVSGAGSGFLVLPEIEGTVTSRVHWDVSDLAPGSSASTTFSSGDFELRGPIDELRHGWIMAGPLGRYPADNPNAPFTAVWLGEPTWDGQSEMKWASEMYAYLGKAYAYKNPLPPYRVFIRTGFPGGPPGTSGTSLGASFMGGAVARAPGAAADGLSARETFTHEMGHMFVGGIAGPDGVTSWFSEGLNVYYTRLLPMRGGFNTVEEYGREINAAFQDYYHNTARNLSADSIVRVGFNDENIRHIPYLRGSLYFADLDSKIRAHSKGRQSLDVVMRELFQRRERGEPFNHAVWIQTVSREAGPSARDDFEAIIIRGDRTLVPASEAFGPCFQRRPLPARTVNGKALGESFEWVRVPSVPDTRCGQW